ncbi:MAG: DUF2889 domain-containing protein [Betaproteobacteria bacterium]|jgi:hypothetical protein
MPLSTPHARKPIHDRKIHMQAYQREDGFYDIESHLVDTKPYPFKRFLATEPAPPHTPLHDLWVRFVLDEDYVVQSIEAASDVTPFPICKEAENTLKVLIGERVGSGWSKMVKEKLRGVASCTHLAEMLIPMATTALQGIRGLKLGDFLNTKSEGKPRHLNSCYAYAEHRDVVLKIWPEYHRKN